MQWTVPTCGEPDGQADAVPDDEPESDPDDED
jgi:hypothetical protein